MAERLFDWTIRNIQLTADTPGDDNLASRHKPYQTLISGRGTAEERAWVFLLLARQQGLDVVPLGLEDPATKKVRPWLSALALGDDLYLFDCRLGLPIPGPTPGSIATLAQLTADPQLLRNLDLDAEHPYPVTAEDLQHVVAFVEGSPASLSYRMALVESRLAGKHKMALTSPGTKLAQRIQKLPGIQDVRLWKLPFDVAPPGFGHARGSAPPCARWCCFRPCRPWAADGLCTFWGSSRETRCEDQLSERPPA